MPRLYIEHIKSRLTMITASTIMLLMLQKVVLLCLVTGSLGLLWSCASTNDIVYKLYPGPERPDTELVTLHLGDADEVVIDGMKVARSDYGSLKLLPGYHYIHWKSWVHMDESEHTVELEVGHAYILKVRITFVGSGTFLWIEDVDNGKVIAGTKKP